MNWIDRYVTDVKRYLPQEQRDDVGDEIQSLIEARLEDDGEAATLAVLKEMGHPLAVASQYRSQRVLVGEALFPIYRLALKYLCLGFAAVWVLAAVISASGVFSWWPADAPGAVGNVALVCFVLVTAAFHLLDGYLSRVDFFARWEPRRLPPLRPPWARIDMSHIVATLLCVLAWFTFLCILNQDYARETFLGRGEGQWPTFILWLKVHALIVLSLCTYHLFRPYWTRLTLVAEAVASVMLAAFPYAALRTEVVQQIPISSVRLTLWAMVIVCCAVAVWHIVQAIRLGRFFARGSLAAT